MAQGSSEDMTNRMRTMENLLIALGNRQMQQDVPHRQPDVLELIARYKPPYYEGQEDPAILEDWIRAFDKIYCATKFDGVQKVTASTYYLKGIADVWWQNHQKIREVKPDYSWKEFKEDLRKRFYSTSVKQAKYEEFMLLQQGTMSVQEYHIKFSELERFAPIFADNEEERARKFEMGLDPNIRQALGGKNFKELQKIYD